MIQNFFLHHHWKYEHLTPCGSGDIKTWVKEKYVLCRNSKNAYNFLVFYIESKIFVGPEPVKSQVSEYI